MSAFEAITRHVAKKFTAVQELVAKEIDSGVMKIYYPIAT